ncbi:MAG: hypothetical protein F4147_12480 [Gammaproteobacteria bacterium]|nr:hypothetical protein [Gammaproteobacteria bacterium]
MSKFNWIPPALADVRRKLAVAPPDLPWFTIPQGLPRHITRGLEIDRQQDATAPILGWLHPVDTQALIDEICAADPELRPRYQTVGFAEAHLPEDKVDVLSGLPDPFEFMGRQVAPQPSGNAWAIEGNASFAWQLCRVPANPTIEWGVDGQLFLDKMVRAGSPGICAERDDLPHFLRDDFEDGLRLYDYGRHPDDRTRPDMNNWREPVQSTNFRHLMITSGTVYGAAGNHALRVVRFRTALEIAVRWITWVENAFGVTQEGHLDRPSPPLGLPGAAAPAPALTDATAGWLAQRAKRYGKSKSTGKHWRELAEKLT